MENSTRVANGGELCAKCGNSHGGGFCLTSTFLDGGECFISQRATEATGYTHIEIICRSAPVASALATDLSRQFRSRLENRSANVFDKYVAQFSLTLPEHDASITITEGLPEVWGATS